MSSPQDSPSTSTAVRHTRSLSDLASPPPAIVVTTPPSGPRPPGLVTTPPTPVPVPQSPQRTSHLHNSLTIAVLDHWDTQLRTPASGNTPTTPNAAGGGPPTPNSAYNHGAAQQAPLNSTRPSWTRSTLTYLGIGRGATPARKSEMSLLWNLCWGFSQVAIVSILAALSGTIWKSRDDPTITEWAACDRPLGVWACLWVARVVLASGLAYWDFVRQRMVRELQPNAPNLNGTGSAARSAPAPASLSTPQSRPSPRPPTSPTGLVTDPENPPTPNPPPVVLPYTRLYSRLTLFSSLLTLSWFLTAHILEYTSLNSCRHTSPHLWWLIFGILCIMYVMVLEVLLLGFIILVLAPILFVFWNIFLFCIGRHPAQNPHMIKPDIGKLSKSLVDRIPLVMYIPPPPNSTEDPAPEKSTSLTPPHEYPPTPTSPPQTATEAPPVPDHPAPKKSSVSRRFRFFKRKKGADKGNASNPDGSPVTPSSDEPEKEQEETWENNFEKSEYPFVVLEGNRAACAICLMDFEEPRRKRGLATPSSTVHLTLPTGEASTSSSPTVASSRTEGELKLADAGEGAQPLRLLACGHVFHQTCLDPWLIDVSGRCPVCQRPVEISQLKKRKKRDP